MANGCLLTISKTHLFNVFIASVRAGGYSTPPQEKRTGGLLTRPERVVVIAGFGAGDGRGGVWLVFPVGGTEAVVWLVAGDITVNSVGCIGGLHGVSSITYAGFSLSMLIVAQRPGSWIVYALSVRCVTLNGPSYGG